MQLFRSLNLMEIIHHFKCPNRTEALLKALEVTQAAVIGYLRNGAAMYS